MTSKRNLKNRMAKLEKRRAKRIGGKIPVLFIYGKDNPNCELTESEDEKFIVVACMPDNGRGDVEPGIQGN